MNETTDTTELLAIRTLRDAFAIGLGLVDDFGPDPFCAVWVGAADGSLVDFVVLTEERGEDVDHLVDCVRVAARAFRPANRVVLWRWTDEIHDAPTLARAYFDRRDRLDRVGMILVDEIVLHADELRSLAVSTFSDEPGWDDMTGGDVDDGAWDG